MADTLSSDGKKVVQGLYDAIAASDVERFFGAMHSQFQAELPGYLFNLIGAQPNGTYWHHRRRLT